MSIRVVEGMAIALVGGWLTVIGAGMIVLTVADWVLLRLHGRREKGE